MSPWGFRVGLVVVRVTPGLANPERRKGTPWVGGDSGGGVGGRGLSAFVRGGSSRTPSGETIGENSKGMSRQSGSFWKPAPVKVALGAMAGVESRVVK